MNEKILGILEGCEYWGMDLYLWKGSSLVVHFGPDDFRCTWESDSTLTIWDTDDGSYYQVRGHDLYSIKIKIRINITCKDFQTQEDVLKSMVNISH